MGPPAVLWSELKRRRMFRPVAAYAVIAFAVLQVTETVVHGLRLPDWTTTLVVILCAAGFPLAVLLAWVYDLTPRGIVRTPAKGPPHIAVLPFANLSAAEEDAYLADAVSDEIINALARLDGLRVAARTSSFALRGQEVRRIGRELGVESVLEGSVQRAGDRLRIATRLVGVDDGYHLWAERFDRRIDDLLAVEDEIARNVARSLRVLLTDRALLPAPPKDVRAYEHCLRGRQFLQQTRRRSLQFARQMFEAAAAIDPQYAPAHAGVAESAALTHMYFPQDEEALGVADAASLRAVELGPDLAEAHTARGLVLFLQARYDDAHRELDRALELNPRHFEAWYYRARASFQRGEPEDAVRLFAQASAVRADYQASFFAAQANEALGRHAEALVAYREALAVVEKHMALNPDDARAATMRAVSLCRIGEKEEGLRWAQAALEIDPQDPGVRYNVACLYALEGESASALECLSQAFAAGFRNKAWIERDPDLSSLRADPRFQQLMSAL